MYQKFVDRTRELEFLERHFQREEAGSIVLYGRRRVGKTEVLGYRSPLYGRRTGQWKLEPLNFFGLTELFPHYSAAEIVKVYATLDAIP